MKNITSAPLISLLLLMVSFSVLASTKSDKIRNTDGDKYVNHVKTNNERRALTLLVKAIKHIDSHGVEFADDFAKDESFFDDDLYVFAMTVDGKFVASGGSSAILVGETVLDSFDIYGKYFFREIVEIAKRDGYGTVEYHWNNPVDRIASPKRTIFSTINGLIIAVGYYPERSSSFEAVDLLDRATIDLRNNKTTAFEKFNDLDGEYVNNDLYIFVINKNSHKFEAHGVSKNFIGFHIDRVLDKEGQNIARQMLAEVAQKSSGEIKYLWTNPITNKKEVKHTFFRLVGDYLVCVGFYRPR